MINVRLGLGLRCTWRLGLGQISSFVVGVWGKDVFDDLQLSKNEFRLKTTLTLTQNANPKLRVSAKMKKMWILRLGLGLRWTWRLGLGQISSFVVGVWGKDVFDDLQLSKNEFRLKTTLTLTQMLTLSYAWAQKWRKCEFYG